MREDARLRRFALSQRQAPDFLGRAARVRDKAAAFPMLFLSSGV
jgi:hypothetical protein